MSIDNNGKIVIDTPTNTNLINPPRTPATLSFTIADGSSRTIRFLIAVTIDTLRIDAPPQIRENTRPFVIPVSIKGTGGGIHDSNAAGFAESFQYDCAFDSDPTFRSNLTISKKPQAGLPTAFPIDRRLARPNGISLPRDKNSNVLKDDLDKMPVYTCDDIWFATGRRAQ